MRNMKDGQVRMIIRVIVDSVAEQGAYVGTQLTSLPAFQKCEDVEMELMNTAFLVVIGSPMQDIVVAFRAIELVVLIILASAVGEADDRVNT
jgi:hypothetical protein